jgi:hypothetical protein
VAVGAVKVSSSDKNGEEAKGEDLKDELVEGLHEKLVGKGNLEL